MEWLNRFKTERNVESLLMAVAGACLVLGFCLVWGARRLASADIESLPLALAPAVTAAAVWFLPDLALRYRKIKGEQLILPVCMLLFSVGLILIYRLGGPDDAWQQITRGLIPGITVVILLILFPGSLEWGRRKAAWVSALGLLLIVGTAIFGVKDDSGARLALKLGPLPAFQTSEWIKLCLLIFLAWWIDREGEVVEGRSHVLFAWVRFPMLRYAIPGALFVGAAALALVAMSDFGAVLILAALFVGMLFAGFDTRLFLTTAAIAAFFVGITALILGLTWKLPATIQMRWLAYTNPWSIEPLVINGQDTGMTIADGPGYQIQEALYAVAAGGLTGTGLGYGHPEFIPLASTDLIFAAILEEMGAVIGLAALALYAVWFVRILRISTLLPREQIFERLLLIGITIHLFTQVTIMIGGTLNLIPLTGVTLPLVSLGGSALLTNLVEIGLAMTLAQRLEAVSQ